MGFENINLWFAKDDNDITVLAKDITKDIKHNNYKCPICGSSVIPRTGEIMSWHFAHRDASKCSTESFIHFWVKHELLKIGDTFKVKMNNEVKEYICKELLIEQKYETYYGVYNPDLTIITDDDETLYIEVAQTNKKKIKDFIKMWNELNNTVIEITTGEVSDGNKIECMNAIWYDGYEYHEQLKELREVGNKEKEKYNFTKEQIDKIDWLIYDIVKYNNNMIEIEQLSDEIQAIEDEDERQLVCNILKNKKCGTVLEDYVEYNIEITKKIINEDIKSPRSIYDRVYGCYKIEECHSHKRYINIKSTRIMNYLYDFKELLNLNEYDIYMYSQYNKDINKILDNAIEEFDKKEERMKKYKIEDKIKHRYLFKLYEYIKNNKLDMEIQIKDFKIVLSKKFTLINGEEFTLIRFLYYDSYKNKKNILIKKLNEMKKIYSDRNNNIIYKIYKETSEKININLKSVKSKINVNTSKVNNNFLIVNIFKNKIKEKEICVEITIENNEEIIKNKIHDIIREYLYPKEDNK